METITSRQNPLMTHIRKLAGSAAYRRQTGQCLCDSPKLLREAAQWGAEVQTVVSVEPWPEPLPEKVRQVLVPPEVMASISPTKTPQGVLFTCRAPALPVPETLPGRRYVVLDGVQDPGNVGTVLRTLDAFDADGLLLTGAQFCRSGKFGTSLIFENFQKFMSRQETSKPAAAPFISNFSAENPRRGVDISPVPARVSGCAGCECGQSIHAIMHRSSGVFHMGLCRSSC